MSGAKIGVGFVKPFKLLNKIFKGLEHKARRNIKKGTASFPREEPKGNKV